MNILKNLLFTNLFLVLFLVGCKKESKDLTTVNFYAHNPVTGEYYSGVKVKIVMSKKKPGKFLSFDSEYEHTTVWEGTTDANGKATFSFHAYGNTKYQYYASIDQDFLDSYVILTQPFPESLNKNQETNLEWQVVLNTNVVLWLKNVNCYDSSDKFRFQYRSISTIYSSWSGWRPALGYYEGCYEYVGQPFVTPQDIWEVEMETTRNGITTTELDTFYLTGQNGIDTVKLFY